MVKERVAFFNGSIVPETEVRVSFRDYGFSVGDGAFDTARSAAHKPFLFKEHIGRLYKSLGYLRLDPGLTPKQMLDFTLDVFERNLPLLDEMRIIGSLNGSPAAFDRRAVPPLKVPRQLSSNARLCR
jgi:branched-chain amino acid aminotransferase